MEPTADYPPLLEVLSTEDEIEAAIGKPAPRMRKRGKSPGTQVQHTLEVGTIGTGFRHFLASNYETVWASIKSARGFAPITQYRHNMLILLKTCPSKCVNTIANYDTEAGAGQRDAWQSRQTLRFPVRSDPLSHSNGGTYGTDEANEANETNRF